MVKKIIAHKGPLTRNHPCWQGSKFNVNVEWENGEATTEPLTVIATDSPVPCAIYAKENNLLDTGGWKRSKKQATVETATYGSEFVAERISIEQVIDP